MTTTLIIVFDAARYNNDIFAMSPSMHVLEIYFDSASRYNMCVYERAMCGGMEIEFRSLRLYFIFFNFFLH